MEISLTSVQLHFIYKTISFLFCDPRINLGLRLLTTCKHIGPTNAFFPCSKLDRNPNTHGVVILRFHFTGRNTKPATVWMQILLNVGTLSGVDGWRPAGQRRPEWCLSPLGSLRNILPKLRSCGATHLGPAHPTRWRLLNTRPNILYRLAKALTGESYSLVRNNPNSNVKKPKDISIRYFHNHVIDLGDGVTSNNITQGVANLEAQSHASNSAPPAEIEAGASGKPSTV